VASHHGEARPWGSRGARDASVGRWKVVTLRHQPALCGLITGLRTPRGWPVVGLTENTVSHPHGAARAIVLPLTLYRTQALGEGP